MRPIAPPQEISGYVSISFSGNMAVIHTKPGYASILAYHIDGYNFPEILGTIAGDDTVMMVLTEQTTKGAVLRALRTIIPNI